MASATLPQRDASYGAAARKVWEEHRDRRRSALARGTRSAMSACSSAKHALCVLRRLLLLHAAGVAVVGTKIKIVRAAHPVDTAPVAALAGKVETIGAMAGVAAAPVAALAG